jgi:hypothetical protein
MVLDSGLADQDRGGGPSSGLHLIGVFRLFSREMRRRHAEPAQFLSALMVISCRLVAVRGSVLGAILTWR